jgi:hypothetical protein
MTEKLNIKRYKNFIHYQIVNFLKDRLFQLQHKQLIHQL